MASSTFVAPPRAIVIAVEASFVSLKYLMCQLSMHMRGMFMIYFQDGLGVY